MRTADSAVGSDYAELLRRVKQAGLLNRRPWHAAGRIVLIVVLFAAGWTGFAVLGESWWQVAVAAFLALVFTQIEFLGHDAGHRQLFRSRRANDLIGLLSGNLSIGLSFGWWMDKHNRHHAHPNHEERDPDVRAGAIVFNRTAGRARRGLAGVFAHGQAFCSSRYSPSRRGACTWPVCVDSYGEAPGGVHLRWSCSEFMCSVTWPRC